MLDFFLGLMADIADVLLDLCINKVVAKFKKKK